jgi:hypothetical protein
MDQHMKFRMDSLKQASTPLGQPVPIRFPVRSTPKLFRPNCKPEPIADPAAPEEQATADGKTLFHTRRTPPTAKDSPHVQKQVKQLQFWLKVFSRFCQDENAHE